jgi:uncharacterized membrane protein
MKNKIGAKWLTTFSVLFAIIVVLQLISNYIKIGPVNVTLTLIPLVIGGIVLGVKGGTLLGLLFGLTTLVYGLIGIDGGFVMLLMSGGTFNVILTILICLVKGTMTGLISSLLFKVIAKKNVLLATIICSVSAPIVNTGLFILGALGLTNVIGGLAVANSVSVIYFLVIYCAGFNFLFELGTTLVFVPAIHRVIKVVVKQPVTDDEVGECEDVTCD